MFGNINDIPDKSFEKATDDLEEESKDQGRTIAPRTLQPPVELLGIPLECVMADYRDRVKLSPFAQKDSLLVQNFFPSNPLHEMMKFADFEPAHNGKFQYVDDVYGSAANYEQQQPLPMLKNRSEISEDIYVDEINDGDDDD